MFQKIPKRTVSRNNRKPQPPSAIPHFVPNSSIFSLFLITQKSWRMPNKTNFCFEEELQFWIFLFLSKFTGEKSWKKETGDWLHISKQNAHSCCQKNLLEVRALSLRTLPRVRPPPTIKTSLLRILASLINPAPFTRPRTKTRVTHRCFRSQCAGTCRGSFGRTPQRT